jgi:hypothetical protein
MFAQATLPMIIGKEPMAGSDTRSHAIHEGLSPQRRS